jgi:hypothetical protein
MLGLGSLGLATGSPLAKAKFARYAISAARAPIAELEQRPDISSLEALKAIGVDSVLLQKVIRPFLAGVFLEPDLLTSRRFMDLVLRSFVRGTPSLPSTGMQAIPEQLHRSLPTGTVRLNCAVAKVNNKSVTTVDHGRVPAKVVIVATDPRTAQKLVPAVTAPAGRSVTTWYHLADTAPAALAFGDSLLIVDANPNGPVINTVVLTSAVASYANPGQVLVSSSTFGLDVSIAAAQGVRGHLARLYGVSTKGWQEVGVYPIEYALPSMQPPYQVQAPIEFGHVIVAGDHRDTGSIQGAMVSGRRTAQRALQLLDLR